MAQAKFIASKQPMKANLFVVAAPSGAGKTTLVRALAKHLPDIEISISHTTRPPRPDDREGVDYFFVTEHHFQDLIKKDAFLEYATVYGYHYGTSRDWVLKHLAAQRDVLLEIDWQGARQIRNIFSPAILIFILPPTKAALKERLIKRRQDSPATIETRLSFAQAEIAHYSEFDYLIVNDSLHQAVEDLAHIVRAHSLRREVQTHKMANLLAELLESQ